VGEMLGKELVFTTCKNQAKISIDYLIKDVVTYMEK
jgi:hypothetical protein